MPGNFPCFLCRLLSFFSKLTFSKTSFRNIIIVANGFEPDQDQSPAGTGLCPNYLQSYHLIRRLKSPLAWSMKEVACKLTRMEVNFAQCQ